MLKKAPKLRGDRYVFQETWNKRHRLILYCRSAPMTLGGSCLAAENQGGEVTGDND